MDLRRFQHFDVLAAAGSLHRAARRLGLSQPALSQSIRALEADVGTRLVERSPSGTRLTRAGNSFLHEIRVILAAVDRSVHVARVAAGSPAPLRLGISPDIVNRRLAILIQDFQNGCSESSMVISDGEVTTLLSMLDARLIDLALMPSTTAEDYAKNMEILWKEELYLALPVSHPLANETIIDLHRLAKQPIIIKAGRELDAANRSLLESCQSVGVRPRVVATMQFRESRLAMVAAGLGLTALPVGALGTERDGVVHRPTRLPLCMSVAALWPASGPTAQAQRFLDMARTPVTAESHPPAKHRVVPE